MASFPEIFEPYELAQNLLRSLRMGLDAVGLERIENIEYKVSLCRAMLRSEMNKRRPIHKLPAEILGSIFQNTLPSNGFDLCDSYKEGPRMYSERHMRILITQVCGRWRAIAFGMATFWRVIDMTTAQWARACFERSQGAQINVFARYPLYNTVETPLGTHGTRIRELFIEIPREHQCVVPTELPAILPPVPNLECLTLFTRSDSWPYTHPSIDSTPRPRVFPSPPLRLTKLVLNNLCWIPGGIPLGQLTHLHLSEGTKFRLQSLLTFLDQCGSLEKLILANANIVDSPDVPGSLSVGLPRLQLLTLGVAYARYSLGCFLRRLVLPPTATVRMFVIGGTLGDVASLQPLPFTADFDTIVVERSHQSFTVQAGVWSSTGCCSTGGPGLFFQFHSKRYEPPYELTHHHLASLIPLHRIQYITVSGAHCDLATDLLPHMPSVAVFRIVEPEDEARRRGFAAEQLRTALKYAMDRFPESTALEIWTRRRRASIQLPQSKAKRTYYQIAVPPKEEQGRIDAWMRKSENDESVPQDHHENGRDGDDWEVIEVLNEPVVDLPGIRPARHQYDWW